MIALTLDEEIEFWRSATETARTKELVLVTFGIQWGLRIAKYDYMKDGQNENAVSVDPS